MNEIKVYKSKIDMWLFGLVFIPLTVPTIFILLDREWLVGALMLLAVLLTLYMFSNTYYVVDSKYLSVKVGFLFNKKIEIKDIIKVSSSRSLLSAPALSLDRLELFFGKFDSILISPKEKQEFVKHLLQINGEIEVVL